MTRTLTAETVSKIETSVTLKGWIDTRRDHGKIVFIDLRDRAGVVQVVCQKSQVKDFRSEDVVEITGTVKKRPDHLVNEKLETGTVEIEATAVVLLAKAKELPFPIDTGGYDISEELRLRYRYLDLRRSRLQRNMRLRSQFVDKIRQYLFSQDFTEIETPMLTKSTPEGSRDFLVPSRLQPGKFYALPQSPQQYKQLLMTAGFERYFQIARALRDEDLRADRGFEHTQIDIEMSFVTRQEVMELDEKMMITVLESMGQTIKQKPFPVYTYQQAVEKFGADKFDLRTEKEKEQGVLAFAWVVDFPFFEKTDDGGWTFSHNPFSNPKPEHKEWLLKKERIGDIVTQQYDLVCNGYEVGGGSIRAHEPEVLRAVFEIMGHTEENIEKEFGHMLEAFSYGTPPHGGLAHGIERLVMTITGEPYLREVVAFPMTSGGKTAVMDAPSAISHTQLEEVGLKLDDASVFEKITSLLKRENVEHKILEHSAVFTSKEAAAERGTDVHAGAKALVMRADKNLIMAVVPGDMKVDTKQLKTELEVKKVEMAKPEEVEEVTGVGVGAVPPFGMLFDLPLYVAESLQDNSHIVFNAGSHQKSIQIETSEYIRLAQPIVGPFSK